MLRYETTRILVERFRECFRFYRDVLGLEPRYGTEDDTYADFATGAVGISLFDQHEMASVVGTEKLPVRPSSRDHVCLVFGVDSVDSVCAMLRSRGIRLVTEPTDHPDWGIRTAHFRDPDGNVIEINQPLPGR